MTEKMHVAFAVCDDTGRYGKYVATAIVSLLQNTKSHVLIHILHDHKIAGKTVSMLKKTVEGFSSEILFHEVSVPEAMHDLESLHTITIGTLFRLYLPSVCPVDKVIYIDVDVLVRIDIARLWEIDIEDVYAAVVLDAEATRDDYIDTKYYRKIGISKESYFNAGVMYMNLKNIREDIPLLDKGIEMLLGHRRLAFADQDVLNYLLAEKLKPLPKIFNYQIGLLNEDVQLPEFPCIMHFSGPVKPWACTAKAAASEHLSVFLQTPYGEKRDEIAAYLNDAMQGYARRMDLKHCLLEREKGTARFINILLAIRIFVGSDKTYRKICRAIWRIRHFIRYNLIYTMEK